MNSVMYMFMNKDVFQTFFLSTPNSFLHELDTNLFMHIVHVLTHEGVHEHLHICFIHFQHLNYLFSCPTNFITWLLCTILMIIRNRNIKQILTHSLSISKGQDIIIDHSYHHVSNFFQHL